MDAGPPFPWETETTPALTLHHVAVQTSDLDRALRFYVDVLGLRLIRRQPFKRREVAWLGVGDVLIELYSKRIGEDLLGWNDLQAGPVHVAFTVSDLDAFLAGALAQNARLHPSHPEPFIPPVPGAGRIAYLLGPDGEEIEIREGG